jgi:Methylpurine-DNA glycosylase (MPG)
MQPHQRAPPDEAMGTDLRQDGLDLCAAGTLWLAATTQNTGAIGKSVCIGLNRNAHRPWRFYERGNPVRDCPKRLPDYFGGQLHTGVDLLNPRVKTGFGLSGNSSGARTRRCAPILGGPGSTSTVMVLISQWRTADSAY